ncbi:MAG TPA: hypothetical protein PKI57_10820 [Myxococcota bacterium]|nr:hypothetical protein [Myxococcota bacterium]
MLQAEMFEVAASRRKGLAPQFVLLMTTVAAVSCGNPDLGSDHLQLHLVNVSATRTFDGAPQNPESMAAQLMVTVSGPDMETVASDPMDFSQSTFDIPEFPQGLERQFMVEYLNGQQVVARGRSVPLDVVEGGERVRTQVFVSPLNSITPVTAMDPESGGAVVSRPPFMKTVGASMTQLDDGRILICGGADVKAGRGTWFMPEDVTNITDACQTYDPRTGEFKVVAKRMAIKRAFHQAVKLGGPNNPDGRVVLIGGFTEKVPGTVSISDSVAIFDPVTGDFVEARDKGGSAGLAGGAGRALFTAALVNPDLNLVAIFGGLSNYSAAGGTWELLYFDGSTMTTVKHEQLFNEADPAHGIVRYNHSMIRVSGFADDWNANQGLEAFLLIGGENPSGVIDVLEPYIVDCPNVSNCKLTRYDDMVVSLPGGGRTMTAVAYDQTHNLVFLVGGFRTPGADEPFWRIDVFGVARAAFKDGFINMGRSVGGMTSVPLSNGTFLMAGGYGWDAPVSSLGLLNPNERIVQDGKTTVRISFQTELPSFVTGRVGLSAIEDLTGRVLIMGGFSGDDVPAEAALYVP